MILILKDSPGPILSAAFGLALGNLLVFLLVLLPLANTWKMVLIALPLVSAVFFSVAVAAKREISELKKFLPLIFVFYLIGGLYYGFIIEHYSRAAIYPGLELFFYILAALAGVYAVRRNREICLALGILAGAASFSLIQAGSPLFINLGMFASQISFALVDLYLLALIIGLGATVNIAGYGLGIMLLAISSGKLISGVAPPMTNILVVSGNIILIGAVLILYFMGRRTPGEAAALNAAAAGKTEAPLPSEMVERLNHASESFQKKFSQKEKEVLELVLQGKPYREVAARIGISESSVKTYMSRIYEKTGTANKEGLLIKLRKLP